MKNVLIVGATGEIGQELCRSFVKDENYQLYVHGRNQERINAVMDRLSLADTKAIPLCFDVSCKEEMSTVLDSIDSLDVVIYDVGILKDQLLCDISDDDWNLIMHVNYQAAVDTYNLVKRKLSKGAGFIVISSISGVKGRPGQGPYAVSKAMLIQWVQEMSIKDKETCFYAISPGPVETRLISSTPWANNPDAVKRIPLKRYAKPDEVAEFVWMLADNKNYFESGRNFVLDGGFTEAMRGSRG